MPVDYDYIKTFGMEIVEGRDFLKEMPNNEMNGFIVNKAAASLISPDISPLGKTVTFNLSFPREKTELLNRLLQRLFRRWA